MRYGEVVVHIPAGKAPNLEQGKQYYSLEELMQKYGIKAEVITPKPDKEKPKNEAPAEATPVPEEEQEIVQITPAETPQPEAAQDSIPANESEEVSAEITVIQGDSGNNRNIIKGAVCGAVCIAAIALLIVLRRR